MMITSLKQPTISFPSFNLLRQRFQIPSSQIAAFTSRNPDFPISKPLQFSEIKGFGLINGLRERTPLVKCEAYEADRSEHVDPAVVGSSEALVDLHLVTCNWVFDDAGFMGNQDC